MIIVGLSWIGIAVYESSSHILSILTFYVLCAIELDDKIDKMFFKVKKKKTSLKHFIKQKMKQNEMANERKKK